MDWYFAEVKIFYSSQKMTKKQFGKFLPIYLTSFVIKKNSCYRNPMFTSFNRNNYLQKNTSKFYFSTCVRKRLVRLKTIFVWDSRNLNGLYAVLFLPCLHLDSERAFGKVSQEINRFIIRFIALGLF